MAFAALLFAAFTLLATLGLFLLLRHHYGLRPAVLWSVLLLLAFAALGAWIGWLVAGSGLR
ncbi:MAG TPA: hypothetical protein VM599_04135 [Thermoanaerobaculia bacterium]|nr:hypothetical protein [Thermoanaerobaculia bacterium]